MAKLLLKKNEFTVESLLEKISGEFKMKNNGSSFSKADIHDWANKKRIPKQYGGEFVRVKKIGPLKVLELSETAFDSFEVQKIKIEQE